MGVRRSPVHQPEHIQREGEEDLNRQLGEELGRKGEDEIDCQHKQLQKKFQSIALKCHPDKTKDTKRHARFLRAEAIWSCVHRARSVLGKVDESGCYALRSSTTVKESCVGI